ncbi:hypothetical protein [Scopulibacillus cellulosilyticus]|uniref:Uncharacterized protein n=1 Tax=Scopulibacillus cellulosilyticus TaxID=2665665 RepID=A0ABW2PRJ3_9BACL
MENKLVLSIEELGFCLMLCGYEEIAAGLIKPTLGEKKDKIWEAIFETASHGLLSKGLWNVSRQKKGDIPLNEEWISFFNTYVHSKKMFRLTKNENDDLEILMFHQISEYEWIAHRVIHHICHEFSIVNQSEIFNEINHFYGITQLDKNKTEKIHISKKDFKQMVLLTEKGNIEENTFESIFKHTKNKQLIQSFLYSLKSGKRRFPDNLSVSYIPSLQEYPTILDVVFILKEEKQLWVISQFDQYEGEPIYLMLPTMEDWKKIILQRIEAN